jgi:hypothetical protein
MFVNKFHENKSAKKFHHKKLKKQIQNENFRKFSVKLIFQFICSYVPQPIWGLSAKILGVYFRPAIRSFSYFTTKKIIKAAPMQFKQFLSSRNIRFLPRIPSVHLNFKPRTLSTQGVYIIRWDFNEVFCFMWLTE